MIKGNVMQIDLKGLRALVTGSTAGIGEAIAARLAQNGAEVVVNGRTAERVTKAIASLQAKAPGARFQAAPGDVATAYRPLGGAALASRSR